MIEQLFGSKTRVKLLQLFYQNPNRSFYVREITRKIDEQINSVRRELANLLSIGIITSDNTNNRLYYEVNQEFEHYLAMSSMFGGKAFKVAKKSGKKAKADTIEQQAEPELEEKTVVQATHDPFAEELQKTGNVHLLVYTGQFTRDEITGVDIVIVGDVNSSQVEHLISDLEKSEKKELRYSIFTQSEFEYRKDVNDRFYANLKQAKKVLVVDKDKLLS